MRRIASIACAAGLLLTGSIRADGGGFVSDRASAQPPVVSYAHDPDCPGCRAFLTGMVRGGPGCNCTPCAPYGSSGSYGSGMGPSGPGYGTTPYGSGAPGAGMGDPSKGGAPLGGEGTPPAPPADQGLGDELFAPDLGTGYGYESAAPGMIGDFFGAGFQMLVRSAGQQSPSNVSIAGGDRRFKIAENYSPFPVDRVFFNYNHFHNALVTADGRDAHFNRGVFGAETTFFDRLMSLEARLPFGSGLNNDQVVDPTANNVSGELGNLSLALKGLLLQRNTLAISAGVGLVLPTGPDTHLFGANNSGQFLTIENEAIYVQPFVGAFWTPTDRFFAQFSSQFDIDTRGNTVNFTFIPTPREGVIQDQTLMYLDASFGYWLFRDPTSGGTVTGLAPMVELHYNTTIEDSDLVDAADTGFGTEGFDQISNFRGRVDVLNLTGALRFEIAGRSYLTIFGVTPLRDDTDRNFDGEFGVQYARLY